MGGGLNRQRSSNNGAAIELQSYGGWGIHRERSSNNGAAIELG